MRSLVCTLLLLQLAGVACAARQVCECAAYVGGTTPATAEEQNARSDGVAQCLKSHGGGTIHGCPMPASMPPMRASMPSPQATHDGEVESADSGKSGAVGPAPALTCPLQTPSSATLCPGIERCVYAQTQCVCIDECHGGAVIAKEHIPPPARWQCSPRPPARRDDGCPGEPPANGSSCGGTMQCSYGLAETGRCWGFTLACVNQAWTPIHQEPPP